MLLLFLLHAVLGTILVYTMHTKKIGNITRIRLHIGLILCVIYFYIYLSCKEIYKKLVYGEIVSLSYLITPILYIDYILMLLNRARKVLKSCLASPPKPHFFVCIPLQSGYTLKYLVKIYKNRSISINKSNKDIKGKKNSRIIILKLDEERYTWRDKLINCLVLLITIALPIRGIIYAAGLTHYYPVVSFLYSIGFLCYIKIYKGKGLPSKLEFCSLIMYGLLIATFIYLIGDYWYNFLVTIPLAIELYPNINNLTSLSGNRFKHINTGFIFTSPDNTPPFSKQDSSTHLLDKGESCRPKRELSSNAQTESRSGVRIKRELSESTQAENSRSGVRIKREQSGSPQAESSTRAMQVKNEVRGKQEDSPSAEQTDVPSISNIARSGWDIERIIEDHRTIRDNSIHRSSDPVKVRDLPILYNSGIGKDLRRFASTYSGDDPKVKAFCESLLKDFYRPTIYSIPASSASIGSRVIDAMKSHRDN